MDQRVCELTYFSPHLSSCPPRKVTTLPRRESSEWIKLVPPPYSTALCTKCLTTALEKCRYVIRNNHSAVCSLTAEAAALLQRAWQTIDFRFKQPHRPSFSVQLDFRTPPGFDRTRNAEIGNKDIKLKHLEEAFTSEHWLVRIYKVKRLGNRDRVEHKLRGTDTTKQKYTSKKVSFLQGWK